jgi:peptidoglycan hydrolase-like protein with peptidoglycan-binding domain
MKIVGAVLLVLLTSSLAGLGVPVSLSQTAASARSKTTSAQSSPARTASKKKSAASSSINHATPSATTKQSSTKLSGKNSTSAAKKAFSKSSSSKRTRRQPGQKAPTADRVSEIQVALAKDGSFQGSPSGKWDEATTTAMRRFQASHGLNASGKLDAPTLQRLGLGSEIAGVAAPTPPPGATSRLTSSNVAAGPLESGRRQ